MNDPEVSRLLTVWTGGGAKTERILGGGRREDPPTDGMGGTRSIS